MKNRHPSKEECLALLKEYKTPEHVIRHCIAVTETALTIGEALRSHGFDFDLELVQSAGLIHDIARVEDKHWEVGATIAERLNFQEEANIIRVHMFHAPPTCVEEISEVDLVCLGDRLVKEDQYVGLNVRMQYILDKARTHGNKKDEKIIKEKTAYMQKLLNDIEEKINITIEELIEKKG